MQEMFLYLLMPWFTIREEYLKARIFELSYNGMLRAGHRMGVADACIK